jgi:hypothetical protein
VEYISFIVVEEWGRFRGDCKIGEADKINDDFFDSLSEKLSFSRSDD